MSMEVYDKLLETACSDSKITEAEAGLKNGEKLYNAEDVFGELKRNHFGAL